MAFLTAVIIIYQKPIIITVLEMAIEQLSSLYASQLCVRIHYNPTVLFNNFCFDFFLQHFFFNFFLEQFFFDNFWFVEISSLNFMWHVGFVCGANVEMCTFHRIKRSIKSQATYNQSSWFGHYFTNCLFFISANIGFRVVKAEPVMANKQMSKPNINV